MRTRTHWKQTLRAAAGWAAVVVGASYITGMLVGALWYFPTMMVGDEHGLSGARGAVVTLTAWLVLLFVPAAPTLLGLGWGINAVARQRSKAWGYGLAIILGATIALAFPVVNSLVGSSAS